MLFIGDGVPHQRPRGLMWLEFAKDAALDPREAWIRDLYQRDFEQASDYDRQAAASLHDARAKAAPPSAPVRDVVKAFLRPLAPLIGSAATPAAQ
jgi:hypothetical protein